MDLNSNKPMKKINPRENTMSRKEQEILRDIKRRWAIQCSNGELFCFLCGKQIKPGDKYNADHWIPRALGGKTNEENLKPACVSCNSKKGCISPEEFELHREEILNGTYKRKPEKETRKPINITPKKKKKERDYGLGNTIYYINKTSTKTDSKVEVKKGVIIGYTEDGCVLVKEFYKNAYNQIESRLVAVVPLSKKKALDLKYKCDDQMNKILRLQTQRLR